MTVHLKVIMERNAGGMGCCGCAVYGQEEKASFSGQQDRIQRVGEILRTLRTRYEEKVEVSLVDPRNMLALWDNFRFRIRPTVPAWILGREKIFEGIPDLDKLLEILDSEVERDSLPHSA
jgi:hypothetical protein